VANLPEPDWLTLFESAERADRAFGAEQSAVEVVLIHAFHDGKIRARGRCRSFFGHDELRDLARYIWDRATVVWRDNKFTIPDERVGREKHIFSDVVVCHDDLEAWINGAMPDSQHGHQEPAETPSPAQPKKKVTKPRGRSGRKLGSGAYTAQDRTLWDEMKSKIDDGKAASAWDAARNFAEQATGSGTFDSKRRRLVKGYNDWISTQ